MRFSHEAIDQERFIGLGLNISADQVKYRATCEPGPLPLLGDPAAEGFGRILGGPIRSFAQDVSWNLAARQVCARGWAGQSEIRAVS